MGEAFLMLLAVMALLYLVLMPIVGHAQGTGTLSISTAPAPTGGQLITTLTWNSTGTCTASGDWSGTKAAAGSETLPAAAPPKDYGLRCQQPGDTQANVKWTPPTQNTDGSALAKCAAATDTGPCLARFRICRGATAAAVPLGGDCRDANSPTAINQLWTALPVGTHFFGTLAISGQGAVSAFGNLASKTLAPGTEWTASVGIKVPKEPTGVTVE